MGIARDLRVSAGGGSAECSIRIFLFSPSGVGGAVKKAAIVLG